MHDRSSSSTNFPSRLVPSEESHPDQVLKIHQSRDLHKELLDVICYRVFTGNVVKFGPGAAIENVYFPQLAPSMSLVSRFIIHPRRSQRNPQGRNGGRLVHLKCSQDAKYPLTTPLPQTLGIATQNKSRWNWTGRCYLDGSFPHAFPPPHIRTR